MSAFRQRIKGFVLHKQPYRETSALVDFFSEQQGKFRTVAKGIRKAKSANNALLQPFQFLEFEMSGKGNLKTLGRVELIQQPYKITGLMLYCGLYLNEILNRILPEGEGFIHLFEHYRMTLLKLGAISESSLEDKDLSIKVQPLLREFEFYLLRELGYLPCLDIDAESQQPIDPECYYEFYSDAGFTCTTNLTVGVSGRDIIDFNNANWNATSLRVAKYVMRKTLTPLLGDTPLKSRELFAHLT